MQRDTCCPGAALVMLSNVTVILLRLCPVLNLCCTCTVGRHLPGSAHTLRPSLTESASHHPALSWVGCVALCVVPLYPPLKP